MSEKITTTDKRGKNASEEKEKGEEKGEEKRGGCSGEMEADSRC